ncbi:MAG: hypothetical protein ACOC5K_04735, partial [Chloroflexota bacterium]
MTATHWLIAWVSAGAILTAVALISLYGWWSGPHTGLEIEDSGSQQIARVFPGSPAWDAGLRNGEVILDASWASHQVEVRTLSFGHPETVREVTVSVAERDRSEVTGLFAGAAAFALLGMFVVSGRRGSVEAGWFGAFAFLTAATFMAGGASLLYYEVSNVIVGIGMIWIPVAAAGFFYYFANPEAESSPRAAPGWLVVFVAVAAGAQVLHLASVFVAPETLFATVRSARFAYFGIGLLVSLGMLGRKLLAASTTYATREQLRMVLVGFLLGVGPFIALSIIPVAAGMNPLLEPQNSVLFGLVIPLAFTYAIMRHKLMSIRRVVHRGVAYAMISVGLLIAYSVFLAVLDYWTGSSPESAPDGGVVAAALLVGVPLVSSVRSTAFSLVDRLLYREFNDHPGTVKEASVQIARAESEDTVVEDVVRRVYDALGLEFAFYGRMRDGSVEPKFALGHVPPDMEAPRIAPQEYEAGTIVMTPVDIPGTYGEAACGFVPELGENVGILCVGPKVTGEPFRDEDIDMIGTLSGVMSAAITRLQLVNELDERSRELAEVNARMVEVEELERARISGYLHDEPLQRVTYVLGRAREMAFPAELADTLEEVVGQLRHVSANLSPAILSDLGLLGGVEWLAEQTAQRADFRVYTQPDGLRHEDRLGHDLE